MDHLAKKINEAYQRALQDLSNLKDSPAAEKFRQKYLGRKGEIARIFDEFKELEEDAKKELGHLANKAKTELHERFGEVIRSMGRGALEQQHEHDFDETIPGAREALGTLHPLTQFLEKMSSIFVSMGFEIVEDREVETSEYNFDKLNIPKDHPARDMWDTFYIKTRHQGSGTRNNSVSSVVLRTHTSPVQLRAMETRRPPVRLVVPGRVYRHEATDASHETNFYQLEGLVIDKGISVSNMIYTLDVVLKALFGSQVKTRIRPSFFPFVEPGHEVDMSCIICEQKGCSVCSNTGWLEMLGSGMVHPVVLKNMGVDDAVYSGFAFGMGIDRLMMLYYGVDDVRLSYSGDLRFLKQF